jgi:hypothetical protein
MPECREAVVEHVESGRLSVRAALDRVGFEVFDVAPEVLRNVNDPENFRERSRQSMS